MSFFQRFLRIFAQMDFILAGFIYLSFFFFFFWGGALLQRWLMVTFYSFSMYLFNNIIIKRYNLLIIPIYLTHTIVDVDIVTL